MPADAHQATDPATIAGGMPDVQKRILRTACLPTHAQTTFPGLLSPDRTAMEGAGLIKSVGYFVVATELGRQVQEVLDRG